MFVFRESAKIIEDKLAFAAGVAGIDEKLDVFSRDEFLQSVENVFRLVDRLEFEFLRNDRERFEPPEAVFFLVDILGHQELGDVTHRGRDDKIVVLEIVLAFLEAAERLGDVAGDGRLLSNDQGLGHGAGIELSCTVFASQASKRPHLAPQ